MHKLLKGRRKPGLGPIKCTAPGSLVSQGNLCGAERWWELANSSQPLEKVAFVYRQSAASLVWTGFVGMAGFPPPLGFTVTLKRKETAERRHQMGTCQHVNEPEKEKRNF